MYHGSLTPSKATEWKPLKPATVLDLASNGRMPLDQLRKFIKRGTVTADMVLKHIDFSDPVAGGKTLKAYYPVLFLGA